MFYGVSVAAGWGTEVEKLAGIPKWNRQRLVHVHAANGIAH